MAHFRGHNPRPTRHGVSPWQQVHVTAGSWQGAVSVEFYAGVAGVDFARISVTMHHGAGAVRVIYDGPASGAQLSEVA